MLIICVLVDGFRSFNDATNERVTSGQSFFALVVLAVKVSQWPRTPVKIRVLTDLT